MISLLEHLWRVGVVHVYLALLLLKIVQLVLLSSDQKGLPAAVSFAPFMAKNTFDGVPYAEACRRLEEAGAAVVGLNCARGPTTMMPMMKEIRQACKARKCN